MRYLPDSFECFIPFDNSTDRIDNFKGYDAHYVKGYFQKSGGKKGAHAVSDLLPYHC